MTTLENVAQMVHSIRRLPQDERLLAAPAIIKSAFELPDINETGFILTILGVELSSIPVVVARSGLQWAGRSNKRKRPGF
jgi:hypothetical protein